VAKYNNGEIGKGSNRCIFPSRVGGVINLRLNLTAWPSTGTKATASGGVVKSKGGMSDLVLIKGAKGNSEKGE